MARRRLSASGLGLLIVLGIIGSAVSSCAEFFQKQPVVAWGLVALAVAAVVFVKVQGANSRRRAVEAEEEAARQQQAALEAEQRAWIEREDLAARAMFARHADLAEKFYQVAERKIVVDEYGEEDHSALDREIRRVMKKMGEREREPLPDGGPADVPRRWETLSTLLRQGFQDAHAKALATPREADVDEMTGTEFETHLIRVLESRGFADIRGTPGSGDQGADLLARWRDREIAIQAKRYKGTVGNAAVQEVIAAVAFYGADEGWVVTNSRFTPAARALAQKSGVTLIDGAALHEIDRTLAALLGQEERDGTT